MEIEAQDNQLVIRAARQPRQGWSEAFRAMAENGDDRLLDEPLPTRWDEDEWRW